MNKYSNVDKIRHIMVIIVSIILLFTIIGVPIAIIIMQLERLIQISCKG